MSVPKVAIIGRPNVGKSSLFNWLSGHLISVVDPAAGSYYFESLTDALAREAWKRFQAIEREGGIEAMARQG